MKTITYEKPALSRVCISKYRWLNAYRLRSLRPFVPRTTLATLMYLSGLFIIPVILVYLLVDGLKERLDRWLCGGSVYMGADENGPMRSTTNGEALGFIGAALLAVALGLGVVFAVKWGVMG